MQQAADGPPGSSVEDEQEVGQGDHMQHDDGKHHGGLAGHVRVRQQVLRPLHACSSSNRQR